jgi:hypothetical protein
MESAMAWNDVLQHPLPVLFVLAALALFAMGEFLARKRRAAPARVLDPKGKIMMQLLEAAVAAYNAASREGLAVAKVAEHARDVPSAADWFARSLPAIVPVYRQSEPDIFQKLALSSEVGTQSQSLYIRKRDLQFYLRWARTVQ